jgi:SAM-dependent MidA family methyltransferase
VVIDYTSSTADMAARPWREWLRTYRDHQRGGHYLADPGAQDITSDVALDQLSPPTTTSTQADFLRAHGLEELVEEGRRTWAAHAAAPDLAALTARSRVREAEALTDPAGLGGFTVAEWLIA